ETARNLYFEHTSAQMQEIMLGRGRNNAFKPTPGLKEFLKEASFDHAGFFAYSKEEETKAYSLRERVSEKEKTERVSELALIQKKIASKKNKERVGREYEVLVEGFFEETEFLLKGRTYFQAPEIDGVTLINKGNCQKGEFCSIKMTRALGYDIMGEVADGKR
ncbi:MAG: hypothetical protein N2445_03570, partial [Acidobacteria bacterium]|nr:hypothetical protein [Acidobacteriota bacterium]